MGQANSSNNQKLKDSKISRTQLYKLFFNHAKHSISPVEFLCLAKNLNKTKLLPHDIITKDQLFSLLNLPLNDSTDQLFQSLCFLQHFPNLSHDKSDKITIQGFVILLTLLDHSKLSKLINIPNYYNNLIYLSLIYSSSNSDPPHKLYDGNELMDVIFIENSIQWSLIPLIQSFDTLEFNDLSFEKFNNLNLILLPLLSLNIGSQPSIPPTELFNSNNISNFKKSSKNLLNIYNFPLLNKDFIKIFPIISPNLVKPLNSLLLPLLYNPIKVNKSPTTKSKILSMSIISQLNSVISTIPHLPLYLGSKHGFSIRSIQSHIFKYNAPTIFLVQGKSLPSNPTKQTKPLNYFNFYNNFPKFHNSGNDNNGSRNNNDKNILNDDTSKTDEKITFAIFIPNHWQISNSDNFSNNETFIIQISPTQQIFKSNNLNDHYAYFSTIGGGIGFGSPPPIKNKFNPGEVSLTIDNNLEIANFRISGIGGTYRSVFQKNEDIWFKINEIEVWGCGNVEDIEEQKLQWDWENREAERRKRLNINHWEDGKALLEMAGIIGGDSRTGGSI